MMRAPTRRPRPSRFLPSPCALAGSRWEPVATGAYSIALGVVFAVDAMTPDDVLAALGVPPVLAALFTLSGAFAAFVSLLALALFGVILARESGSRLTIISIGLVGVVLGAVVRIYATSLAEVMSRGHQHRPLAGRAGLPTVAAVDKIQRDVEWLTRREMEVALLAADGYMASEIGDRLHISRRTVESHLAHVYAKLGVNSRRALRQVRGDLTR